MSFVLEAVCRVFGHSWQEWIRGSLRWRTCLRCGKLEPCGRSGLVNYSLAQLREEFSRLAENEEEED